MTESRDDERNVCRAQANRAVEVLRESEKVTGESAKVKASKDSEHGAKRSGRT